MHNYYYDAETDSYYVLQEDDGSGLFSLLVVLAVPFFLASLWLRQCAMLISEHPMISGILYLVFSLIVGELVYKGRIVKHKRIGILGVIISLLPIALIQYLFAIPEVLSSDISLSIILIVFGWLLITAVTVGIAFFMNAICLLFKNGIIHLIIAFIYWVIFLTVHI